MIVRDELAAPVGEPNEIFQVGESGWRRDGEDSFRLLLGSAELKTVHHLTKNLEGLVEYCVEEPLGAGCDGFLAGCDWLVSVIVSVVVSLLVSVMVSMAVELL